MQPKMTSGRFPMSDNGATEHLKKFIFATKAHNKTSKPEEKLEITIPELLQAGYSFYTWPSAPILAWFLWEKRHSLPDKRIIEIGSGTALPGILAAKCGAIVTLSDSCTLPKSLNHIQRCCLLNGLKPGENINIIGLSWGLLLNNIYNIGPIDYIIASDCFYDPTVFEDILVTVAFLLENNTNAKFVFTYQERSTDWSLEALLKKWNLKCVNINLDNIGKDYNLDLPELMSGRTIHLLEITHK